MDVTLDPRLEEFVATAVRDGRYGSASEVVSLGLQLVAQHEGKLAELRAMVTASIAEGGQYTSEEISRMIDETEEELRQEGF